MEIRQKRSGFQNKSAGDVLLDNVYYILALVQENKEKVVTFNGTVPILKRKFFPICSN